MKIHRGESCCSSLYLETSPVEVAWNLYWVRNRSDNIWPRLHNIAIPVDNWTCLIRDLRRNFLWFWKCGSFFSGRILLILHPENECTINSYLLVGGEGRSLLVTCISNTCLRFVLCAERCKNILAELRVRMWASAHIVPLRIVIFSSSTEKIKSISLQAPRDLYGAGKSTTARDVRQSSSIISTWSWFLTAACWLLELSLPSPRAYMFVCVWLRLYGLWKRSVFCPNRLLEVQEAKQLVKEILSILTSYLGAMVALGIKTHI